MPPKKKIKKSPKKKKVSKAKAPKTSAKKSAQGGKAVKNKQHAKKEEALEEKRDFVVKKLEDEVDSGFLDSEVEVGVEDVVEEVAEVPKKQKVKKKKLVKKKDVLPDTEEMKIEEKLTEIYENGDGSMPDMQTFEKRKRSTVLTAFFVLLFSFVFFAVVAWVGFFVVQPSSQFSEEDVILSISGEEDIKAGQELSYRIRYRNAQNVSLGSVKLEIRYPEGFQYIESSVKPSNENNDTWDLGVLAPQESGYIDVTGRVFADLDTKQSFRVFLNYIPASFSSSFQKVAHVALSANESIVRVHVEIPEEVAVGSETGMSIILTPEDGEALEYISVVCESDSFIHKKEASEPAVDENTDCQWSIDSLENEQIITLNGSFTEENEASIPFVVKVLGWDTEEKIGDGYVLAKVEKEIALVETDMVFNLAVNGGVSSLNVEPGEILVTSLVLRNSGETPLDESVIRLTIDAPSHNENGITSIIDWNKLEMGTDSDLIGEQLSDTVRRGEFTWDKRYIPDLDQVNPGEEIKIDLTLPIKDGGTATLSDFEHSQIDVMAELQYGEGESREIVSSNKIILTIESDLEFEVRDEVLENTQGQSIHTVTWLLSNSFHDLHNIAVSADIYGDIELSEDDIVVPAGEVEYDAETKHIVWNIEQMPADVDVLAMQFSFTLLSENPTQTQLTSKARLSAEDGVIESGIVRVGDEILLQQIIQE
ncbi:hypothetical protein C0581_02600 [Candidatus Parcubacteria bacterium]|nr:MAG: hypothetical protein C0581_02600 [Candidatus Parcubacteria bacterium]